MNAVEKIGKVLQTRLLSSGLVLVPDSGATEETIGEEEKALGRRLSTQHRNLLTRWNGMNLEVIRFYGCKGCPNEIPVLRANQLNASALGGGKLAIASDPAGFVYLEDGRGQILCYDTDGGSLQQLARDFDDFVVTCVFGEKAALFADEEWLEEVRAAGLA